LALQPIPAEFAIRRAAQVLAVSLTYVGSGISGIAMGCLAGWFSMRPIAIGCGLMIALGLVVTSSGGLHQLCACNLVLLGLIGGAGMFSPTTPMSRVGSTRGVIRRWALVSSGNTSPTRFGLCSCRSASTAMAGAER
jgi:hypothetical protein